jgi:PAS domain S-box-containing protein
MKNILSKRILYSIELSAFIMVCLLVAIWYNIKIASSKEQWVNHTDEVMIHVGRMQYAASESSILARNFMLTGEAHSLTLFNDAVDITLKELDYIRILTADNPKEKPLLDSSTRYLIKRIDFSKEVIKTRKEKGAQAAIALVQSGYGTAYIDKANYYIQRIGDNESRLLQTRKDESKKANLILNVTLLITITFVLALLFGMLRKSGKEVLRNKRLIKELTKKDERNRQAEQLAAMGTWNMNMQTKAVTGSDEMYRIWGLDENKKGNFADDFIKRVHPDDQEFIRQKMHELPMQNDVDNYNFRLLINGDIKYISTGITVNRDDNNAITNITGYAQDVTHETVTALKLETANEELKVLFNKIGEVRFSRDTVANCFIHISDTCEQLTGYTIDEFKTDHQLWVTIIHPDDRNVVYSANSMLEQGDQITSQYRINRKDGELRWVENKIIPTMGAQGVLVRIDAVLRDITEKKTADIEREKIMDELLKRNNALEEFTYIVSHNLRKPVANIMGLTQLLEMGDIDADNQHNIIERLHSSVDTLDEIVKDINDILQIKNHISDKKESIYFCELMEKVKNNLSFVNDLEVIDIEENFTQTTNAFTIYNYLYSIFYNIILNSIKYRRPDIKTLIQVKTACINNTLELIFTDNGKGIDLDKNGSKLFGLYRRFDNSVQGKGMGLFMVKTQVEALGGTIDVKSELQEGTRFCIKLPLQKAS